MPKTESPKPGILYIVATPIGNLEDMTFRAVRILKEVDLIAAEDTRHTKALLNHYGIRTRLISYYREKERERTTELIERLRTGNTVALVSDAGTPGISDPGAILVNAARQAEICIVPIPGPSALTTAVSTAGLENGAFLFLGFAPAKAGQRRKFLRDLVTCRYPVVFYESPRRIRSLIAEAMEILGNRQAFWGREMTKAHEDLVIGTLNDLLARATDHVSRGESVLIIFPDHEQPAVGETIEELLLWYRDHLGLTLKDACRRLAADLGQSRSAIYRKALEIWHEPVSPSQPKKAKEKGNEAKS